MNREIDLKKSPKKFVYFDGTCPMCSIVATKLNNSSQTNKFDTKDMNTVALPSGMTKEAVEKEIHVIDVDGKIYRNADAILMILEEYPHWKFLAKLGRLPILKQLLQLGYKFVASNRHFIFGSLSRIYWMKIVLAAGLIAGLLLSIRLWTGERLFPLVSMFKGFPVLSRALEAGLFVLLLTLLILTIFGAKPRKFIWPALGVSLVFIVFDQMRLQPWFFQYFFMFLALGVFSWKHTDTEGFSKIMNILRLIVVSIYFYSGLQKLNLVFASDVFPWIAEPLVKILPDFTGTLPLAAGFLVPFVEMGIALCLLSKKWRKLGVVLALLMWTFLLFVLGPLGHNWNSVVWPWNIAMAAFTMILFWRTQNLAQRDVLWPKNFLFHRFIFIVFALLPLLSFFNLWDSYLSASLYSGNTNQGEVYVSDAVALLLPPTIFSHLKSSNNNQRKLDIADWSFKELNVPIYPEKRIFKSVTKSLCNYADVEEGITLKFYGKKTWKDAREPTTFGCDDV